MINVIVIAVLIIWAFLAVRSIRRKKRLTSCGCSGSNACAGCTAARSQCHSCQHNER